MSIKPANGILNRAARERFKQYLRSESQKYTPERAAVLEQIASEKQHFEADDLYMRLRTNGMKISRATVYRTLDVLVRSGIVDKVDLGGNRAYFEYVYGMEHHDHLICVQCGKVLEFQDTTINKHEQSICKSYKFEMIGHAHSIYGRCKNCKKTKAK